MNTEVLAKYEKLRNDYNKIKGRPFTYFFCPIIYKDENTCLCKAHIVNATFHNFPKAWTIQRQDVDNFYGSYFESEFIALQYKMDKWSPGDILIDKKASKLLKPKLLIENNEIEYFHGSSITPNNYTKIELINQQNKQTQLILKIAPDDFINMKGQKLEIEINKDIQLSSLVSLIKTAHLILFEMFGYSYVFSAGGYFVGRQILGEFYTQNSILRSKTEVIKKANIFFKEFVHIVRPIQYSGMKLLGTISDHLFLCCKDNNNIWALIVIVRTDKQLHAIMIPVFDNQHSVIRFFDFLKDTNESIDVNLCSFESKQDKWKISKSFQLIWPKAVDF